MAVHPPYIRIPRKLLLAAFLFSFSTMVTAAMFGLFKTYDVHLCPEVKGQIVLEGKPVAGVKITRSLVFWDEDPRIDSITTDENGEFSLPEVNIRSKKPGNMLVQEHTAQKIYAELEGQKYLLWFSVLPGYESRPEYARKLTTLNCELSEKLTKFEFRNDEIEELPFTASSLCHWDEGYIFVVDYDEKY